MAIEGITEGDITTLINSNNDVREGTLAALEIGRLLIVAANKRLEGEGKPLIEDTPGNRLDARNALAGVRNRDRKPLKAEKKFKKADGGSHSHNPESN